MTEKQDPNQQVSKLDNALKKPQKKPLADLEAKRAQNLRDNLLRRKQQARARAQVEKESD